MEKLHHEAKKVQTIGHAKMRKADFGLVPI